MVPQSVNQIVTHRAFSGGEGRGEYADSISPRNDSIYEVNVGRSLAETGLFGHAAQPGIDRGA